jgi:hypothetical protein
MLDRGTRCLVAASAAMLVCGATTAAASPLPAGLHVTEQTTTPGGGIATWSESTDVLRPGQPGWVDAPAAAAIPAPCAPGGVADPYCSETLDLGTSVATSEVGNDTGMASAEAEGATQGNTAAGAPVAEGAGSYEQVSGRSFYGDGFTTACANRLALPSGCGNPYNCYSHVTRLDVTYYNHPIPVKWNWEVHIGWCGYERGSITSHSYDDQNFNGSNCTRTSMTRVPLEKINNGHWQEHSKATVKCELHEGGANFAEEDDAMAGAHFYSNGTYSEIRRNG